MGACSASGAGYRAADAVRRLRRAGSWRGRLRNLLGKIVVHCATVCPRLGIPFVYDPGPGLLSMEVIADPPAYARARAAVRCDDVARTLVHALKYRDRTDLAPAMGRWMAPAGQELLGEADALVTVPLHWRRGWSRRYYPLILLIDMQSYIHCYTLIHRGHGQAKCVPTILHSAA
jgi:predicted amidophosphoribosyltransferase